MELTERQLKEKIRYLSDKLENLYENIKPVLEEFELTQVELNELLDYVEQRSDEK